MTEERAHAAKHRRSAYQQTYVVGAGINSPSATPRSADNSHAGGLHANATRRGCGTAACVAIEHREKASAHTLESGPQEEVFGQRRDERSFFDEDVGEIQLLPCSILKVLHVHRYGDSG
jgi:hypothetical protein